jgi:hypothetical protein
MTSVNTSLSTETLHWVGVGWFLMVAAFLIDYA